MEYGNSGSSSEYGNNVGTSTSLSNKLVQRLENALASKLSANELKGVIQGKQDSAFTPSVPSNWSPAPTSIQSALDQLAARVHTLGG